MKVAALDIGPRSVHLAVATVASDGSIALLGDYAQETTLAEGLAAGGPIEREAVEQTLRILRSFRHIIRQQAAVDQVRACSSAALGTGPRVQAFLEKVKETLDVTVEMLALPDEAAYAFLGTHDSVPLERSELVATLHVASDTTSVTLGDGQRVLDVALFKFGPASLTRRFVDSPLPAPDQCLALSEHLNRVIDVASLRRHAGDRRLGVVVSGVSPTALASLVAGKSPSEHPVHGARLDLESVYQWFELLARTPVSQRSEFPGLPLSHAKEILAGTGIVLFVMDKLETTEVVVSAAGLRHGMLREMLGIERSFA